MELMEFNRLLGRSVLKSRAALQSQDVGSPLAGRLAVKNDAIPVHHSLG